jgi:AcrR family transcriptional regulator
MPRRSREEATQTKNAILGRATALGSLEGLESLTIGRLADELGLSKSGVYGHFGSKENLQLSTVEAALKSFRDEVWEPAADEPPGLPRLRAVMDAWLSYLERSVFPGGCFLTAASLEFDDRPGPVREVVATTWTRWLRVLAREIVTAQEQGELDPDMDPDQAAFELNAHVMAGNWAKQLFGGPEALEPSRAAIDLLLTPGRGPRTRAGTPRTGAGGPPRRGGSR